MVTDRGAAVQVRLPRTRSQASEYARLVRGLPSGTPVALWDATRWARRRCRRFAAGAKLEIANEYLAVPSLQSPLYLVEDTPETLLYFWSEIAAVPVRTRFYALAELALRLVPALGLWRWTALVLSQRIVVGKRR